MFRRTLAAVVISASLSSAEAALFVGYDLESDEERTRRQNLRVDAAQPPPGTDPGQHRPGMQRKHSPATSCATVDPTIVPTSR